jgi:hypothetical protein
MAKSDLGKWKLVPVLLVFVVVLSAVSAALAVPPAERGKPVPKQARIAQSPSGEEKNPAKRCKAERARMGAQAFADEYGTNPNKRNAFGKCVSGKAKEAKPKPARR